MPTPIFIIAVFLLTVGLGSIVLAVFAIDKQMLAEKMFRRGMMLYLSVIIVCAGIRTLT